MGFFMADIFNRRQIPQGIICGENTSEKSAIIVNPETQQGLFKIMGCPYEIKFCPQSWGNWTKQRHVLEERKEPRIGGVNFCFYTDPIARNLLEDQLGNFRHYYICEGPIRSGFLFWHWDTKKFLKDKRVFTYVAPAYKKYMRWFEVVKEE